MEKCRRIDCERIAQWKGKCCCGRCRSKLKKMTSKSHSANCTKCKYVPTGEDDGPEEIEGPPQKVLKAAVLKWTWMTKDELMVKYNQDSDTVDQACEMKKNQGASRPHPDFPSMSKMVQYKILDSTSTSQELVWQQDIQINFDSDLNKTLS